MKIRINRINVFKIGKIGFESGEGCFQAEINFYGNTICVSRRKASMTLTVLIFITKMLHL